MSKKIYLFSLVLLALAFTACSETEETSRYDNWQARSVAFIDSIASVCNSPEIKLWLMMIRRNFMLFQIRRIIRLYM